MGRPSPSKTRPSISSDTPSSILRPRKRTLLLDKLIPVELSKSCTSTSLPSTSSTLQRLVSPSASSISPSSSYVTPSTPRTSISGPATSCMVLYSFGIYRSSFTYASAICALSSSSTFLYSSSRASSCTYLKRPICSLTGMEISFCREAPRDNASEALS